jgi:ion channel-forming bestrophin family protein
MVTYDPKEWFRLIFRFHKSDTFRRLLPTMLLLGFTTALVCYFEKQFFGSGIPTLTLFHQISGFVISLVLVFRINTAYDRWWEGRKLWGSLVNNTRNLAIRLHAVIPPSELGTRETMSNMISNFPFCLKEFLRNSISADEIIFSNVITEDEFTRVNHKPNYMARQINQELVALCSRNVKTPNDFLVMSEHVGALTDIAGACERIRNTPIPYSYSIFIKKMIFLYIITMPVDFGLAMGYWAIPVVMIMFYAFASLELISEEIEDPFGTDSNDLPLDDLSMKIRVNVNEILLGRES